MDIPISESIAFGDGENDKEFLAAAGIGCAMKNGRPAAKDAANIITEVNMTVFVVITPIFIPNYRLMFSTYVDFNYDTSIIPYDFCDTNFFLYLLQWTNDEDGVANQLLKLESDGKFFYQQK